jgi:(S)-ureidoglycine aminohydrolase
MSTIVPGDRGRRGRGYTLLTPANRYVSRIPNLPGASLFKLVTPRMIPARFGMYLISGVTEPLSAPLDPGVERFLLGRGGEARVLLDGTTVELGDGGFVWAGPSQPLELQLEPGAEVIAIKRPYEPWPDLPEPDPTWGRLSEVEATATAVPGLMRRELLDPADPGFDFNISHMEFGPDVALAQIEIHDEEHGLYMTSGGGLYRLDTEEHEVRADDFIYMAPYCPQGFRAGPEGGSYLLYKDVYRDGFPLA